MSDIKTPEERSLNMAHIKGKDTSIEVKVRHYLFGLGFRYRKNDKRLPGKPDIVLPKYNTVILVHGCFWHRHPECKYAATPKTRVDFWKKKFAYNVDNDRKQMNELAELGWNVIVVWECEVKKQFDSTMNRLVEQILQFSQC